MEFSIRPERSRLRLFWLGLGLVVALVAGAGWWFLGNNAVGGLRQDLVRAQVSFPMFYLKAVPEGISIIEGSVESFEGVVMFGLASGTNRITVAQQARPKFMEEVTKVKAVPVPAGSAYVAKLNERTVGFLATEQTLVIVSSVQPLDAESIAAILSNLASL